MPLNPDQRYAQRSLVGTLNLKNDMWFDPDAGLCIWRDGQADKDGRGSEQISANLDVLNVPYSVRLQVLTERGRRRAGFTIVVAWADLAALTKWVPSFQKQIDGAHAQVERPTDETDTTTAGRST